MAKTNKQYTITQRVYAEKAPTIEQLVASYLNTVVDKIIMDQYDSSEVRAISFELESEVAS